MHGRNSRPESFAILPCGFVGAAMDLEHSRVIMVDRIVRAPCILDVRRTPEDSYAYMKRGQWDPDDRRTDWLTPSKLARDWVGPRHAIILDAIRPVWMGGSIVCLKGECILRFYEPYQEMGIRDFFWHLDAEAPEYGLDKRPSSSGNRKFRSIEFNRQFIDIVIKANCKYAHRILPREQVREMKREQYEKFPRPAHASPR